MIFGKLNKVFEDQYKTLPLKKVRLKTDPKFDKLPYEGYILAEAPIPTGPGIPTAAPKLPPGKSLASKAGGFLTKVDKAYTGIKSGAQKFKEFGQGNISVITELMGAYGEKLLQSALDKSTLKLSLFGKKGYNTGYISTDDPYYTIISKYVGVDNLNLTFNIGESAEYNKDTLYPIFFTDKNVIAAFKNKKLGNGNYQRLNYVKNSKVVDSYPNNGTFFIYNINGEAVPELTSDNVRFEYDPKFRGYKMGKSIASKAEPGNGQLILYNDLYDAELNVDKKTVNFRFKDLALGGIPIEAKKPFAKGGLGTDDNTALNAVRNIKDNFGLDFSDFENFDFIVEISSIKTIPITETNLKTTVAPKSAPITKSVLTP